MAPILKVGTEKRPFLRRGQNRKMGPKSILCQKKKLQNAKRLMFFLGKRYFFVFTTFHADGRNRYPDFCPKILFVQWDPVFFKRPSEGMDLGSAKALDPSQNLFLFPI